MKKSAFISAISVLLACLATVSYGAEDQIIIEDLSRAELRSEIEKIQNEIYRVFNASVSDEKFVIVCHTYTPTGSNIREEACEPLFVIDKRSRNAEDSQRGFDTLITPGNLQTELASQFEELTDAMNALAEENQYFRELNSIVIVLRERLEEIAG